MESTAIIVFTVFGLAASSFVATNLDNLLLLDYLLMALLWSGVSLLLVSYRGVLAAIERYGEKLVQWIMIGVGCYILLDTPTDTLI